VNIVILGNGEDAHARHLHGALTQVGAIAHYLDTRWFPTQLSLSWQPGTQTGSLKLPDGHRLRLHEIHSVFWRTFAGVNIPELHDADRSRIALNDSMSALRSLIQAGSARWINSWQAYQFHKEKPLQLDAVQHIGVPIPATLISNDPEDLQDFAKQCDRPIFKPVYGGAHTQFVTSEHLEGDRLRLALRIAPVTLQEYIPGTNIRTYVIAESVYAAEIRSPALDFREDTAAELIPIELPEVVRQQCLAIRQALMLEWTAIDWRLKPSGDYIFLEANPSPMFLHFEKQTGFPITQKLVEILTRSGCEL
jgi:glutathione synthase/RimK-type ligase-like ATP-grasp enzyme